MPLALVAIVTLAVATEAATGAPCCGLRPQDQLWLVSDRGLGCANICVEPRLQYWRYDCQRHWTRASLEELLAAEEPQANTVVYLHGNRLSSCDAFERAWTSYRALARCADARPIRYIAWSWPSDKMGGPIQDARLKAARTDTTAYYLAWFLDRLDPAAPLSIWAHSFGARAATGALHLLGGGVLCGRVLDRVHTERVPVNAVLLASALDNGWIVPGRFHGQALTMTAHMLLVNNCADRLLKHYELLWGRRSGRMALGYAGISRRALGVESAKVTQIDASGSVGKQHQFMLYVQSANLMSRMRATLLSAPSAPTNTAAAETVDEAQAEEKSRPESEAGSQLASANENSRSAAQAEPPE
jgi:hypothetical protein